MASELSQQDQESAASTERVKSKAPGWRLSPWLLPAAGLIVIVVVDQLAGATGVVRVAAVATALTIAGYAVPAIERPAVRAIVGAAVLAATAAVLVALDQPDVRDAIEPNAGLTSTSTPSARSLRGSVVRPEQLARRDLRGLDLSSATLDGLDLRGRVLDGNHLEGASLSGADLRGAQLRGAHLEGARLRGTRLDGACLIGAHLDGTDTTGATFAGADVTGLSGARAARRAAASWPAPGARSSACG